MADPGKPAVRTRRGSKVCSVCSQNKTLTEFNRHRRGKDGLDTRCRQCRSRAGREWYRQRQQRTNRLYSTYMGMKARCCYSNHRSFPNYGGRGIAVCEEWLESFDAFVSWAMNNAYHPDLQLDRIDNDQGYAPDNCRFVTPTENAQNRRDRSTPLKNSA